MRGPDWLSQQLPVGMLEDDMLRRFVRIFQDVADTVFDQIDTLGYQFDPGLASPPMVRHLGRLLGFGIDSSMPEEIQRELVRTGGALLTVRGTRAGLVDLVTDLTGGQVEVDDSGGVYGPDQQPPGNPPHVVVRLRQPKRLRDARAIEDLARLLELELPIGTALRLEMNGRQVWPPAPPAKPEVTPEAMSEVA